MINMAIDHSSCDHPRTPAGRRACRALHGAPDPTPVLDGPPVHRGRQRRAQARRTATWTEVPRDRWFNTPELKQGMHVRVIHSLDWANPEGMLMGYVHPQGWASVDLGEDDKGIWRGVRHVPSSAIQQIFIRKGK